MTLHRSVRGARRTPHSARVIRSRTRRRKLERGCAAGVAQASFSGRKKVWARPERPAARVTHFGAGAQVVATIVTDVTFTRLTGAALMNRPFTSTVWPVCAAMSNSEVPIRR